MPTPWRRRAQQLVRAPSVAVGRDVVRRFGELHGNDLAAAVTLQLFLALFPLLLVLIAVIGAIASRQPDVASRVTEMFGLTGPGADLVSETIATAEESRRTASIVGALGLAWSGLGLVGALQSSYNQVWAAPGRGWKDRVFGAGWLVGAVVLFAGGAALAAAVEWLPAVFAPLTIVASAAVTFAFWMWTARVLPNRDIGWRHLVPGALFSTAGLLLLEATGVLFLPRMVAGSSQLYGALGTVFALLAWLLLFGRLVVLGAVVNLVAYERDHGTVTMETHVVDLSAQEGRGRPEPHRAREAVSRR